LKGLGQFCPNAYKEGGPPTGSFTGIISDKGRLQVLRKTIPRKRFVLPMARPLTVVFAKSELTVGQLAPLSVDRKTAPP
jgi:hypothetical protein